jgi:pimeloyl-ACP methyl ester carboxylesterase
MKRSLLAAASAIILSACATTGPYHANRMENGKLVVNSIADTQGKDYRLAFVEFGEQGSYHDITQLEEAVRLVRETPGKVLLIMYVHGWHNNAVSGDVERFENFLGGIASSQRVASEGFKVIGLYLGWRGESLKIPGINSILTIWDRKSAAERLASNNDCIDAISDLSATARSRGRDRHYVVLMGHSLGGLVVERAVAHSIAAAVHSKSPNARPGDLIFTLNPASDSILTRQLVSSLSGRFDYRDGNYTGDGKYYTRTPAITFPGNQQAIVALSAKNDRATGGIFPIGMRLGQMSKVFPKVQSPSPADAGRKQSEQAYYLSTPGNKPDLVTHDVEPDGTGAIPAPPGGYYNALEANLADRSLEDGRFLTSNSNPTRSHAAGMIVPGEDSTTPVIWKRWKLVPRNNARTPYWIVQVPGEIINDHGGIWDPNAQALMAAIFRLNFPLREKTGLQAAPESLRLPATRTY